MSDALGDETEALFGQAQQACQQTGTAMVLVLSKSLGSLKDQLAATKTTRVLSEQPVTLRSIRQALEEVWNSAP